MHPPGHYLHICVPEVKIPTRRRRWQCGSHSFRWSQPLTRCSGRGGGVVVGRAGCGCRSCYRRRTWRCKVRNRVVATFWCHLAARFTLLYSHGNDANLGQIFDLFDELRTHIRVNLMSPICSLIASDFGATERQGVRLYYGARNFQRMTYQESFKDGESTRVKIIPVLSQPDERWSDERGYVQTAFSRAKDILNPSSTVVVLCGRKQMAENL
ncbi:hypothetical protein ZIOFF_010922 [Zingiber officinale]|uniref:Oxidoreductase FAD/NAD(P)-binding domain-containing protein n=1 Tax=Zingiber officinale TaxID=94328 RepID=A0A8J5LYT3_ZINOF|nr:hypothetical protein ZIOFF_010922 [Zingiber officinale]